MQKRGSRKTRVNSYCSFSPKSRRGQFYLIAAIIITAIIAGFVSVTNYASAAPSSNLGYLKDEILIESQKTIINADYINLQGPQMIARMENFSYSYINSSSGENMYFVFGNLTNATIVGYQHSNLKVLLYGSDLGWGANQVYTYNFAPTKSNVTLEIEGNQYNFTLYPAGGSFHFVVSNLNNGQEEYASN